jgi:hypothetical protein
MFIPKIDNSVQADQTDPPFYKEYILVAIGIITFLGSLVATGYFYDQLGNSSLGIAGGGLAICTICFLLKYYFCNARNQLESPVLQPSQKPLPRNEETPLTQFNRKPCKYEGNTCFINTSLQTAAHLPDIRWLFDDTLNILEKREGESDDSFAKRKKVQSEGKELIHCILSGKQATNLRSFVNTVQDSLNTLGESRNLTAGPSSGGSAPELTDCFGTLLFSRFRYNKFMVNRSDDLKKEIESALNEKWYPRGNSAPILKLVNVSDFEFGPVIDFEEFGKYRLEVVTTSTNYNNHHITIGHATPIIRLAEGKYLELDDLSGRLNEVDEASLFSMLKTNKGWTAAYYAKIRD